jgi:uncharacterized protein (TIGR03083 family)
MNVSEHVDALAREGARLEDVAARTDLDARVPSCPGWTARDVVQHTGEVHRWAAKIVRNALTESPEEPVVYPPDAELLGWFHDGHAALLETLSNAPPDLQCFTFLPAPSALAFWARRQAHETAIHRVDAETAAGAVSTFPPEFATDGVDELLYGFASRKRSKALPIDTPRTLRLHATDTDRTWTVVLQPDGIRVVDGVDGADCAVSAPASDCYLLLWNRRDLDGMKTEGEPSVVALWRDTHRVRWS